MKLITEDVYNVQCLTEANDKGVKSYYLEGTFLQGEIVNQNGRLYPIGLLDREVSRYINENIKKNCAYGELGHPTSPTVNLDRVSHMIKEFRKDGNNYWGRAKLLDTPMGKIAKSLVDEGANLGVSSRGLGTLRPHKNGYNIVQDDFKLAVGADIVASPSAPDAFVQGVFEGAEWVFDAAKDTWMEQHVENIQKIVETERMTEEYKAKLFHAFISGIARKPL